LVSLVAGCLLCLCCIRLRCRRNKLPKDQNNRKIVISYLPLSFSQCGTHRTICPQGRVNVRLEEFGSVDACRISSSGSSDGRVDMKWALWNESAFHHGIVHESWTGWTISLTPRTHEVCGMSGNPGCGGCTVFLAHRSFMLL
jgi:hypothetical protein